MKKLLGFMFGYGARGTGPLGWGTRLSQPDHLYHQGRNFLSMVIYGLFLLLMFFPVTFLGGILAGLLGGVLPAWAGAVAMLVVGCLFLLPMFYLSFATIKLTVLRLHDLGFSGWWIFYSLILGAADFCLDSFLPAFTLFVSIQSLTYLGLLLWPGSSSPNKYGEASLNSTATKQRWIRIVPLVLWAFTWVVGMTTPFATLAAQQAMVAGSAENAAQRAYYESLDVTTSPEAFPVSPTTSNTK